MIYIKKKYLIFTIIILVIVSLLYISINKQNEKTTIIEAKVLFVGTNYLLVTDNNENDYLIYTKELKYNIGDIIKLEITDINRKTKPYEANSKNISILTKKETISDNQEHNQTNNNSQSDKLIEKDDTNNEKTIIQYFEKLDKEITNYHSDEETLSQKIKSKFESCIDFIFYDKEINGIKFKELANITKLKILEITISIDSKIDSKFPNYKENINNTYQDTKSKIIEKYLNITTDICNKEQELCNTAKENFQTLKDNFKITWEFIKNLTINNSTKLKDWYEIWRYN